jgi:hypothetical protein
LAVRFFFSYGLLSSAFYLMNVDRVGFVSSSWGSLVRATMRRW